MIVGAGTEATGAALSITTYYLLASPARTQRLRAELLALSPSPSSTSSSSSQPLSTSTHNLLTYPQLQNCTYLSACIAEGLRLSKESNRMPRINHQHPTIYKGMEIPAGAVVSMSLRDIHLDPEVYVRPREFVPERWLGSSSTPTSPLSTATSLPPSTLESTSESTPESTSTTPTPKDRKERPFAPFGRGSRGCVGRELAMVELYVVIGNLFRDVGMGLWETGEEDIRQTHDFFSLEGGEGRGLRVVRV